MGASTLTFRKIRAAAIDQSWSAERTSKGHHKLVPPDATQKIVFTSGTPGDFRAVNNFLAEMRRSGLIWPPPPKQPNPAHASIVCANGGAASVEAMLGGVGSSTVRRKTADSGSTRLNLDERKDVSVTAVSEEVRAEQMNGHSMSAPIGDFDPSEVRWAALWIPDRYGPIQRYRLSTDGDCISDASGSALKRALLGHQCYVNITNSETKKTTSLRLDKLMLWTFVGEPKSGEIETPVHANGDTWDCALTNLRWRKDTELQGDVGPQRPLSMPSAASAAKKTEESVRVKPPVGAASKAKAAAQRETAAVDDDVSVSLTFQTAGMTLQYRPGGWSISPCENLTDDQVKAVGRMISRWERVHDGLY